ncbi:hypothetical protein AALO_G00111860 [Alosa alosa]|uniref:Uncharacterized protein n=1 Tax=Alosa alosa TaxID=278164 RepID=A0AAV6GPC1_9TELE|nr:hypothetical protein AALO_G00111860 [Alosa alosa]
MHMLISEENVGTLPPKHIMLQLSFSHGNLASYNHSTRLQKTNHRDERSDIVSMVMMVCCCDSIAGQHQHDRNRGGIFSITLLLIIYLPSVPRHAEEIICPLLLFDLSCCPRKRPLRLYSSALLQQPHIHGL